MQVLSRFLIVGTSMNPTLPHGTYVLTSSLPYLFTAPKRGDVVLARHPQDGKYVVKRISRITESEYFVTGDNEKESTDSRHFGLLKRHAIIGKVVYVLTLPKHD